VCVMNPHPGKMGSPPQHCRLFFRLRILCSGDVFLPLVSHSFLSPLVFFSGEHTVLSSCIFFYLTNPRNTWHHLQFVGMLFAFLLSSSGSTYRKAPLRSTIAFLSGIRTHMNKPGGKMCCFFFQNFSVFFTWNLGGPTSTFLPQFPLGYQPTTGNRLPPWGDEFTVDCPV